jgi:hypothetical protein
MVNLHVRFQSEFLTCIFVPNSLSFAPANAMDSNFVFHCTFRGQGELTTGKNAMKNCTENLNCKLTDLHKPMMLPLHFEVQ